MRIIGVVLIYVIVFASMSNCYIYADYNDISQESDVYYAIFKVSEKNKTAEDRESDRIIVSLGDSYSSGEGIEPFYGQLKSDLVDSGDYMGLYNEAETVSQDQKVNDSDWIAHRSQYAWSGMLYLPGVEGNMAENRGVHWFFSAASGAETKHIKYLEDTSKVDKLLNKKNLSEDEEKELKKYGYQKKKYKFFLGDKGVRWLEPQLNVFKELGDKKADYVTLSIGGNDLGFSDIIREVVTGTTYLGRTEIYNRIFCAETRIGPGGDIREKVKKTYLRIADMAGSQATVIVVGYPELLNSKGFSVSEDEADIVNFAVRYFDVQLNDIVNECNSLDGKNIEYVSVIKSFENRQAYSDNEYINGVILHRQAEDISSSPSAYSMHPNFKGACAYAECVQKKINELEKSKGRLGNDIDNGYKEAYLEKLRYYNHEINNYNWQFRKKQDIPKPVALYDICGDGTPELFMITAFLPDTSANLHIYTYSGGEVVEIYKDFVDSTAGSGNMGFLIFSTHFSREVFIFKGYSDDFKSATFDRLVFKNENLEKTSFLSAESPSFNEEYTFKYKEKGITKKDYDKTIDGILYRTKNIIICDDDYQRHFTGTIKEVDDISKSYNDLTRFLNNGESVEEDNVGEISDISQFRGCDIFDVLDYYGFSYQGISGGGTTLKFDKEGVLVTAENDGSDKYIVSKIGFKNRKDKSRCYGIEMGDSQSEAENKLKQNGVIRLEYCQDKWYGSYWYVGFMNNGDVVSVMFDETDKKVIAANIMFRSDIFTDSDMTPEQCFIAIKNYYYGIGEEGWSEPDYEYSEYWTVSDINSDECILIHRAKTAAISKYIVNMKNGETELYIDVPGVTDGEKLETSFNALDYLNMK